MTAPQTPPKPYQKGDWPPKVAGETLWRSWADGKWYWRCPTCQNWFNGFFMEDAVKGAERHCIKEGHYV